MNNRYLTIALTALAVLLVGCSPSPADGPSLEGTQWVLVALDGEPPLAGTAPSAEFSADQISGSTGCNHYFGPYTVSGSDITVSDVARTEMGCTDPEGVMDQEEAFLAALASAASYRLSEARLELLDATGGVILAFEPPPAVSEAPTSAPPTPTAEAMGTEIVPEPTATTEPAATESPDGSEFWVEMQDPQYGVGFAVPCYWEVNFPQEYPPGGSGISYSIRNYPEEYVLTFPKGHGVFENGGIKIDMNFMHGPSWGADAGTSLTDFVSGLYSDNPETDLVATEELVVNGQPALLVTIETMFGTGQSYFFVVSDEIYLSFGSNAEARSSPDVLGILNSIALTPDVSVAIPRAVPENPPKGLLAPCLGITELPPDPDAPPEGCQALSFASVEELSSGLEENVQTAQTVVLIWDYVNEPFAVALWGSEGQEYGRNELGARLANSYYAHHVENIAEGRPSQMTFTTDRGQFPPLMGISPESMFGPDVDIAEVIYSEGWGQDGLGAALLFIAEDDCGRFYWHGLVFSTEHFDK